MKDWNGRSFSFDISDPKEPIRTFRARKPCHLSFEIDSWSGLKTAMKSSNNQIFFETPQFVVGTETWSMIIYPEGDKKRGSGDYISMYLKRHQSNTSQKLSNYVSIKFFILHQPSGQYLVIEDLGENHYDVRGTQWGIPQVIGMTDFKTGSNGLLVDDQVTFGAEVFVTSNEPTYSRLSTVKFISRRTFTLIKFTPLSGGDVSKPMVSKTFTHTLDKEPYTWKLELHRTGYGSSTDTHWSLFLVLDDTDKVSNGRQMLVSYELSLLSKSTGSYENAASEMDWISGSKLSLGFPDFIDGSDVFTSSSNYAGGNSLDVKVQFNSIFLVGGYDSN